jgi:uracil-DNA glycosylase family 4
VTGCSPLSTAPAWPGSRRRCRPTTVRCAPPNNKPTTEERDTCRPWLEQELRFLQPWLRVIVALGAFAWASAWPVLQTLGYPVPARPPRFAHLEEVVLDDGLLVLGSYHPSQQNTFTGKLTASMLDEVFVRAREHAEETG